MNQNDTIETLDLLSRLKRVSGRTFNNPPTLHVQPHSGNFPEGDVLRFNCAPDNDGLIKNYSSWMRDVLNLLNIPNLVKQIDESSFGGPNWKFYLPELQDSISEDFSLPALQVTPSVYMTSSVSVELIFHLTKPLAQSMYSSPEWFDEKTLGFDESCTVDAYAYSMAALSSTTVSAEQYAQMKKFAWANIDGSSRDKYDIRAHEAAIKSVSTYLSRTKSSLETFFKKRMDG